MNNVEKNSVPADPSRKLTGTAPFRVIAGRGIVDAEGRVIANCQARMVLNGLSEWDPAAGYTVAEADDNAHGIAHVLNAHDAMRAGLRYILEAANAASVGALHSDTFSAERVAQWARDAMNGMFPIDEPPCRADRFLSLASEDEGDPAEWYVSKLREDGTADGDVIAWCETEEDADRIAAAMNAAERDA